MLALTYGIICYAIFFVTFLYAIGLTGNLIVPKGIDSGETATQALAINLALLALFWVQHSVMARPAFKRWWTRFIPQPVERSTYVLATCLALILLFWLWRPMPGIVWNAEGVLRLLLWGLFWLGWLTVLVSTFLVNHYDLFGLRQVYLHATGRSLRADRVSDNRALQAGTASDHAGLHRRLLGNSDDGHGAPVVRGRHDSIHPAGNSIGRARFG